tara:strand:- start:989 stop:1726 length:738 start_codon:yes stop_codon:yes gene_type:complete
MGRPCAASAQAAPHAVADDYLQNFRTVRALVKSRLKTRDSKREQRLQLPPSAAGATWTPALGTSRPVVRVLSVMSRDLLLPGSHGRTVAELTALWALAHGMEYSLVTCDLRPRAPLMQPHWSKPRALLAALRQPAVDYVLLIDADAAVRNPAAGVEQLLRGPQGWSLSIACSTTAPLPRPGSGQPCSVNSGVLLARNDTTARAIVQWWASLGEGSCPPDTHYAEQDCAQMAVERSRQPWVHEWRG